MNARDSTPAEGESAVGVPSVEQREARTIATGLLDPAADQLLKASRNPGSIEDLERVVRDVEAQLTIVRRVLDTEDRNE